MPKVIMLVSVELEQGKRDEYLQATQALKSRFASSDDLSYTVFENQGREKNSFTEMFTFSDMASYEAFDDRDDEEANEAFARIIGMAKGKPKYTTLIEVE